MATITRTFAVASVKPATRPLETFTLGQVARTAFQTLEAVSDYHVRVLVSGQHNTLLWATYRAFLDHRPLVLSPDMLWVTILQGLARHVDMRSEELRSRFVRHPGKLNLRVEVREFVLGSPENPWEEVIAGFEEQMRHNLVDSAQRLLSPSFSTTGLVERAASQVAMMSALKSYFNYEGICVCGIPSITLEGTPQDWAELRERARNLAIFGLEWWTSCLVPILDHFVAASEGRVDLRFWRDIYQTHPDDSEAYGGPYPTFSGWIGCFFPFLSRGERNPLVLGRRPAARDRGVYLTQFDTGLCSAPVQWRDARSGRTVPLQFLAGLMGVQQDPFSLALRPKVAWAVRRCPYDRN